MKFIKNWLKDLIIYKISELGAKIIIIQIEQDRCISEMNYYGVDYSKTHKAAFENLEIRVLYFKIHLLEALI